LMLGERKLIGAIALQFACKGGYVQISYKQMDHTPDALATSATGLPMR